MKFTKELRKSMAVAYKAIQFAKQKSIPLTPFKLIKVMYLANLSHIESAGKPIIEEKFCKTQYGPNLFSVFILLKPFGSGVINPASSYFLPWMSNLDPMENQSIEESVDVFGKMTDGQLIDLSRFSFE